MPGVVAFVAGLVFALGLGIAGMTLPRKVLGFLDVTGDWDPTLAFVMGGAVAVYALASPLILRRPRPLLAPRFAVPTRRDLDARLVVGAAVFGIGWGLVGFCPGPALVALGAGVPQAAIFSAAMLAGMGAYELTLGAERSQRAAAPRVDAGAAAARVDAGAAAARVDAVTAGEGADG